MKKRYAKELLDPRWQRKRLEIMGRDLFKCRECDAQDRVLHVHHRYYVGGRKPWEYPSWALVTLCEACHSEKKTPIRESDGRVTYDEWEVMAATMGWADVLPLALAYHVFCKSYALSPVAANLALERALNDGALASTIASLARR